MKYNIVAGVMALIAWSTFIAQAIRWQREITKMKKRNCRLKIIVKKRRRESAELRLAVRRAKEHTPNIKLLVKNPKIEDAFRRGMEG